MNYETSCQIQYRAKRQGLDIFHVLQVYYATRLDLDKVSTEASHLERRFVMGVVRRTKGPINSQWHKSRIFIGRCQIKNEKSNWISNSMRRGHFISQTLITGFVRDSWSLLGIFFCVFFWCFFNFTYNLI